MVCVRFMLVITPDLSSGVSLINQSTYASIAASFIILMTLLFTNAMDKVYRR